MGGGFSPRPRGAAGRQQLVTCFPAGQVPSLPGAGLAGGPAVQPCRFSNCWCFARAGWSAALGRALRQRGAVHPPSRKSNVSAWPRAGSVEKEEEEELLPHTLAGAPASPSLLSPLPRKGWAGVSLHRVGGTTVGWERAGGAGGGWGALGVCGQLTPCLRVRCPARGR